MNTSNITPLLLSALMILSGYSWATETSFSKEQRQQRIDELSRDTVDNDFAALQEIFVAGDKEDREEGIKKAFGHRRSEAIDLARKKIKAPEKIAVEGGRKVINASPFNMAADIAAAFPDDSLPILLNDYKTGDGATKSNILRAIARAGDDASINDLLTKALDDKTFVSQPSSEIPEPPMRVCDVAYNELLFRYQINSELAPVGLIHTLAKRDERIQRLKTAQLVR